MLRDSQLRVMASSELVPGDVVEVAGEEPGTCEHCVWVNCG